MLKLFFDSKGYGVKKSYVLRSRSGLLRGKPPLTYGKRDILVLL